MITPINIIELTLTLFVFSQLLYKDTILYRISTLTVLYVAVGNAGVYAIKSLQKTAFIPIMNGNVSLIIPIVLGLLLFTTLIPGKSWMSRPSYGMLLAIGTGIMLRSSLLLQLKTNILYVLQPIIGGKFTPLDNLIGLIIVVSMIVYFLFTVKSRDSPPLSYLSFIGRYAIMIGLGTSFAVATITRLSWLGGRVDWILKLFGLI